MPKIQIVNPTAPEMVADQSGGRFPEIRESHVGVLENGKQHAELILTEIARALGDRYGVIHATTQHKSVALPADPAVIDTLVNTTDWVLVGSAD